VFFTKAKTEKGSHARGEWQTFPALDAASPIGHPRVLSALLVVRFTEVWKTFSRFSSAACSVL
jgi:hypothetical protein